MRQIDSVHAFQVKVEPYMRSMLNSKTTDLTVSGLNNLKSGKGICI